ncbi:sce7725 family protein [Jeotgalicoccus sp. FSL K6-3177]|uniref:sce7725 family protein n=1 Tax=Jeotgalicoccus sp. FSL K6-3177 TaxID=2921494 RepID=UPI0030FDA50E
MYFPLLRGRQYDLLAIRDLKSEDCITEKIIPIIEPVKISPTLKSTVAEFENKSAKLIIIVNPKVGSLEGDLNIESLNDEFLKIIQSPAVLIGHYLNKDSEEEILEIEDNYGITREEIALLHSERSLMDSYSDIFESMPPKYNFIPDDRSFKRKLNGQNLIILEDKFNRQLRNRDYEDYEDEFFSEEHLYYKDEGYIGFSDYSIVGKEFNEGGFAPYAVAIHIVYPNDDNSFNIIHFVSDTNDDISNPAGKFNEAAKKLNIWYESKPQDSRLDTLGLQTLLEHYKLGTYPGLPTLKKLCIMHHIELVETILDGEELL